MTTIIVCSLLVLWLSPLPLEGRTLGRHLANRADPVEDLQKLASTSSPFTDLLLHFPSPKRSVLEKTPTHLSSKRSVLETPIQLSSKRSVFDILPHRAREEEEARSLKFDCSRLVRSSMTSIRGAEEERRTISSSAINWRAKVVANQSKLKSLIKKLVREYILVEKIRLLRNGRSTKSSVAHGDRKPKTH